MNHEERRTIAVWRYGIIAPALSGTHDYPTDNAFFRAIAKKRTSIPSRTKKNVIVRERSAHGSHHIENTE